MGMELKKAVAEKIEVIKKERYKVMFVIGSPLSGKTTLAKEIVDSVDAEYIDYLQEVLPKIKSPALGAYSPIDFREYLRKKGNNSQKGALIIDEIKWLISTWSPKQRKELPRLLSFLATKSAIILVVTRPCEWINDVSSTSRGESRVLDIDQYGERYG
jgi:replication-associated recombination protein RarA